MISRARSFSVLIHVVCFKYNAEVSSTQRHDHRAQLQALADLDEVSDLKVGEDVVRSARSYDTGLVVTFPDRAALDAYQVHPRHVAVVEFAKPILAHVVAVDFDA